MGIRNGKQCMNSLTKKLYYFKGVKRRVVPESQFSMRLHVSGDLVADCQPLDMHSGLHLRPLHCGILIATV